MTEERLRELQRLWQRRLGLAEWDIELRPREGADDDTSPVGGGTLMRVVRHSAYQRAVINVDQALLEDSGKPSGAWEDVEMTDQRVEITLVHELLHLWTGRIVDFVEDDLDGMIHRDAMTLFTAGQRRAEEHAVDTLARALVRAFAELSDDGDITLGFGGR